MPSMKIMLVDDSNTMRRIQRNALEQAGLADIVEAIDGKDAYDKLFVNEVGLILLDINMPNMNGMELLRAIRATDRFKDIKVIMCTSESEKQKIVDAMKAGANNYIVKPFTPKVLSTKLMEMGILK